MQVALDHCTQASAAGRDIPLVEAGLHRPPDEVDDDDAEHVVDLGEVLINRRQADPRVLRDVGHRRARVAARAEQLPRAVDDLLTRGLRARTEHRRPFEPALRHRNGGGRQLQLLLLVERLGVRCSRHVGAD